MEPSTLALFWAGVIALSILVYVLLDGFDLRRRHPVRRDPPDDQAGSG